MVFIPPNWASIMQHCKNGFSFFFFLQQPGSQAGRSVCQFEAGFSSSQSKPGAQMLCLLIAPPWGCSMHALGQGWGHQGGDASSWGAFLIFLHTSALHPPSVLSAVHITSNVSFALWHCRAFSLTCCYASFGLILICLWTDAVSTPGSVPLTAVLQPSSSPQGSAPCLLSPAQARHSAQAAVSVRYSTGAMPWARGPT